MPITIQKSFEDFSTQMQAELFEFSARLEPLEDSATKIRTKIFAFFGDYIQELKNGIEAPDDRGYPIKMVFEVPASKRNALLNTRQTLLNSWTSEFWGKFCTLQREFETIREVCEKKAKDLESYRERVAKAAERAGKIAADSHLLDASMLNVLHLSKVAMVRLDEEMAPFLKRYASLRRVASKAKELMWTIHGLPESWKYKVLKDGTSGLTWSIMIRLNEDWVNELERLNVKGTTNKIPGSASLENPSVPKRRGLKILNKYLGPANESTSGITGANPSSKAVTLDIVTEALAEAAFGKLLVKRSSRRKGGSKPAHKNSPSTPLLKKRSFSVAELDESLESAAAALPYTASPISRHGTPRALILSPISSSSLVDIEALDPSYTD
ncbi:hypothetical protein TWF718_010477 [Orbilia javanica]|uniref:Uncharacterized protein n=1 Tax=Orbilia javanica TaxID=47235 RepID=A0AAN8MSG0_9PEZI